MHWTYVQRVSRDAKSLISNAYIYLSSFLYNYSYTVILIEKYCFMNVTVTLTAASVLVKLYVFLV